MALPKRRDFSHENLNKTGRAQKPDRAEVTLNKNPACLICYSAVPCGDVFAVCAWSEFVGLSNTAVSCALTAVLRCSQPKTSSKFSGKQRANTSLKSSATGVVFLLFNNWIDSQICALNPKKFHWGSLYSFCCCYFDKSKSIKTPQFTGTNFSQRICYPSALSWNLHTACFPACPNRSIPETAEAVT